MRQLIFVLVAAAVSSAAAAQAYLPDFDPAKHKGPASGPANEVLVLGSSHLSTLPPSFDPGNLRMAANIRDVLGAQPGTRMLVIVGASH